MIIQYEDIKLEFRKMGLSNKEVAEILNISVQGLDKRINAGSPSIHLITHALSHQYKKDKHKHSYQQCQDAVSGLRFLIANMKNDKEANEDERCHNCESAIAICDQLLQEPEH